MRIFGVPDLRLVSSTIGTSEIVVPRYIIFMSISTMHSKPRRSMIWGP